MHRALTNIHIHIVTLLTRPAKQFLRCAKLSMPEPVTSRAQVLSLQTKFSKSEVIQIFPGLPISDVRHLPLSSRLSIGAKGDAGRASLPRVDRCFEQNTG